MQSTTEIQSRHASDAWSPGKFAASFAALVVVIVLLVLGFILLRSEALPQILAALFAIVWGVGGVAALYTSANMVVESLPLVWRNRIQPYIFVGPAIALLAGFLAIPTLGTFYQSFFDQSSTNFVGLNNYIATFTDRQMLESFRNNVFWLVFGTAACVVIGLLVAVLADRSKFENIAKAIVFMPMAISFVGAGVIWRFIYSYAAADQPQINRRQFGWRTAILAHPATA
jgi:alpha-glucoside transport system permease protein